MRQLIIIIVVLALTQLGQHFAFSPDSGSPVDTQTLVSTGFILLAAYAFGELFRRLRLPALLGYLASGVVFGPSLAALTYGPWSGPPLTETSLHQLGLVNMLAVGVIGTMGGGELRVADLKENLFKLVAISASTFVLVIPAIGGLVLALSWAAPSLVPFVAELPIEGRVAAALLMAVLAAGMSPSATLALLQEVRARGKLTNLVLGTVVVADLVLVATFLLALSFAQLLISPEGFSFEAMSEALPRIAAEFGWAIILGIGVGVLFIAYLRLVGREVLLFSLGVIFVTSFVASRLHAETLLAFLIAGFVVQNFSSHGHTLIEAFEHIALPVFVIYFTTQAANLDLTAVSAYLPLTLLLVGTRCTTFYFGTRFGCKIAKVEDELARHLPVSFFSQGGVDLVLAAIIAESIPSFGPQVQIVTMATILFYIVGGPPFLARALDALGESAAARERGEAQLAERRRHHEAPVDRVTLDHPQTADNALSKRLFGLYVEMNEVMNTLVADTVAARARKRSEFLSNLAHTITLSLRASEPQSADAMLDPHERAQRIERIDAALLGAAKYWRQREFSPIDAEVWDQVLTKLAEAEPFSAVYRVTREAHLFERKGKTWQRALRALRRVRRLLLGPGARSVPTGRLWRYHIAFEVPIRWWEGLKPREAELWHGLLEHYQATRRELAGPSDTESWAPVRQQAIEREEALVDRMRAMDEALERELTLSIAAAWREFLEAVAIAGTFELPAWRYRLSAKYDIAQAAKAQLGERILRDQEIASGRKDALHAVAQAHHVAHWARSTVAETCHRLGVEVQPLVDALETTIEQCAALESDAPSHEAFTALGGSLRESLHSALYRLDAITRKWSPQTSGASRGGFAATSRDIVGQLAPSVDFERAATSASARRVSLSLRSWLSHTLFRDVAMGLLSAEQDLETRIHQVGMSLHHAKEVLEYHLSSASTTALSLDRGLGERLATLVRQSRDALYQSVVRMRKVLEDGAEQAIGRAVSPILAGQWDEIGRGLRRLEGRDRPQDRVRRWVRDRKANVFARLRLRWRKVADEMNALFAERSTPEEAQAFRAMVLGPRSTMPEVYQRLFVSVPAETIGLIVERKEAAALRQTVDQWQAKRSGAILIRGDRGIGKRTLVRQLLGERSDAFTPRWIRLSPVLEREADVAAALAEAMGWPTAERFDELTATASRRVLSFTAPARPVALVLENTERLFRRNAEGIARMRSFLELVHETASEVLWLVMIAEPAARALEGVVDLHSRFARILDVRPLDAAELKSVVQTRHRLSGYRMRFAPHAPSLQEWVRHPALAWRLLQRGHDGVYERLWRLSGGNVRQALQLWLTTTQPDPHDTASMIVGPLTAVRSPLLESVPLAGRFIVRALLLLGPLTLQELALEAQSGTDLETELARLAQLGLVRLESMRAESGAFSRLISLEGRAIAPLTEELRQCNLL